LVFAYFLKAFKKNCELENEISPFFQKINFLISEIQIQMFFDKMYKIQEA